MRRNCSNCISIGKF